MRRMPNKLRYNKKYDRMGVNPNELYLRQNGICHLMVALDSVDGKEEIGDLYCTDGNEYAPTGCMLNPTFECVKCISSFLIERLKEMEKKNNNSKDFMTFLMKVLVYVHSLENQDEDVFFSMSIYTFDHIKEFLDNNTVSSVETSPVRETGVIKTLFGVSVLIDNGLSDKTIMVKPTKKMFRFE
jgi:hypothetical protein